MKNRTHLLLLGAILPLGLASCGSTPGGESGSTPKEKGYTVSEAYWTKNITQLGYFGADANLTMKKSICIGYSNYNVCFYRIKYFMNQL